MNQAIAFDPVKVRVPRSNSRPCYVNGLTTYKTYLVVAVKDTDENYTAMGVRPAGHRHKIHFWPNALTFGYKGKCYGTRGRGNSNGPYEGAYMTTEEIHAFLDTLKDHPDFVIAPLDKLSEALSDHFESSRHLSA